MDEGQHVGKTFFAVFEVDRVNNRLALGMFERQFDHADVG